LKTLKNLVFSYRRMAIFLVIILVMVLVLIGVRQLVLQPTHAVPDTFVARVGSQLLLKGKPFRFSGANIYWLGLDENVGGVNYPTRFRVDDALATAQEMGATVVRSHTLGISVGCPLCIEPSLGVFNEAALQHVDYAIMSAKKHGIKLIIPLVDNFHFYHGGKHTFTDWRGIADERQFYSNATVIGDFEQYISHILDRVNSYTGIAYKDDPTILGWETGNGLSAPTSWVQTIAGYMKSIDPDHLIIDGNNGQSYDSSNFAHDLDLSDVDIYTGQYYPLNSSALNMQAGQALRANKVFIAEEYAWNNMGGGSPLSAFLTSVETNFAIAGDLFWSLFSHNDTYGYVQHHDGYTLHYPGDTQDMRDRVEELRAHAYAMKGVRVPVYRTFGDPLITKTTPELEWRGVAGAFWYTIERSQSGPDGPWIVICDRCTDNETPWMDKNRPVGLVWYRIKASNPSGAGNYSAIQEGERLPVGDPCSRKSMQCQTQRAYSWFTYFPGSSKELSHKLRAFQTERSNRCASVAQRFERIVPKGVCLESLKSYQAPFRQKILHSGSGHRHQVRKTIHSCPKSRSMRSAPTVLLYPMPEY
jgi:mannan endo-1,4-beta-mannosidase